MDSKFTVVAGVRWVQHGKEAVQRTSTLRLSRPLSTNRRELHGTETWKLRLLTMVENTMQRFLLVAVLVRHSAFGAT